MCRDECKVDFFQTRDVLMSGEGQWLRARRFIILLASNERCSENMCIGKRLAIISDWLEDDMGGNRRKKTRNSSWRRGEEKVIGTNRRVVVDSRLRNCSRICCRTDFSCITSVGGRLLGRGGRSVEDLLFPLALASSQTLVDVYIDATTFSAEGGSACCRRWSSEQRRLA